MLKGQSDKVDFYDEDQQRADRIAKEWLHVERTLDKENIQKTLVFFGSARITSDNNSPLAKHYNQARFLVKRLVQYLEQKGKSDTTLVTGGGPGIMEAANKGAFEAGGKSIGLNILLPNEQHANPFITKKYSFEFHYFALRKMHFVKRATAIVVFPGGYGTLDELMEILTLIQTKKIPPIPIILFGKEFWSQVINFEMLVKLQLIAKEDLNLYTLVDHVDEAFNYLIEVI